MATALHGGGDEMATAPPRGGDEMAAAPQRKGDCEPSWLHLQQDDLLGPAAGGGNRDGDLLEPVVAVES